ncbi:MAG: hypothetical protein J5993_01040 [Clostridia bacterium]|nr:hypothetical protein [Clostridia bacterium]
MLKDLKEDLIKTIVITLIGVLVGIAMILIPHDKLIRYAFIILGIAIVLFTLPEFIHQIQYFRDEPFYEFVLTCLILALGFVLIFFQKTFMFFVIGGVMLVVPVFKILTSNAKMAMLRTQLPCLILGIVILILGPSKSVNLLFDVAGWIIIALSVGYAVYFTLFLLPVKKSKAVQKEYRNIGDE